MTMVAVTEQWIATVILNRPPKKAQNGVTGSLECPLGGLCTAPHGRHHSMLVWSETAQEAREMLTKDGYYVARIEGVAV